MAPLTQTSAPDTGFAGSALSFLHLPDPSKWLNQVDGDPDDLEKSATAFRTAASDLQTATTQMTGNGPPIDWSGAASEMFQKFMDAVETGFKGILEGLIWLVEWVVAIVEMIITLFLFVAALIVALLFTLWTLVATIVTICTVLMATPFGQAAIPMVIQNGILSGALLLKTSFMTFCGQVMIYAAGTAVVLAGLKWLLDKFHDKLDEWRAGLLDYTPDTPDWDPDIPSRWPTLPKP